MKDQYGRTINYMRISLTDRCNLRCKYCMPEGIRFTPRRELLTYEELLRVCSCAVRLGITRFKLTGGEPLVRRGCVEFLARLKALPGCEQVTLTTNGLLLAQELDGLCRAGVDGINISIDSLDEARYRELCGMPEEHDAPRRILELIDICALQKGIKTKINALLLRDTADELAALAALAETLPVDVRFIELMPIGDGANVRGLPSGEALDRFLKIYPDLHETGEHRGNGPARYYASERLLGRIAFIDAISHRFCASCNRVRLTSVGGLKPCLCYSDSADLRGLLRGGCTDAELEAVMEAVILEKPMEHCFSAPSGISERQRMNQIGG